MGPPATPRDPASSSPSLPGPHLCPQPRDPRGGWRDGQHVAGQPGPPPAANRNMHMDCPPGHGLTHGPGDMQTHPSVPVRRRRPDSGTPPHPTVRGNEQRKREGGVWESWTQATACPADQGPLWNHRAARVAHIVSVRPTGWGRAPQCPADRAAGILAPRWCACVCMHVRAGRANVSMCTCACMSVNAVSSLPFHRGSREGWPA